jgi:hypothetical protein
MIITVLHFVFWIMITSFLRINVIMNDIGEPLLMAYWQDPDFDLKQRAFYYVRVLEIPTPRWSTYDAAFYGVDLPEGVPPTQQEYAYTASIWYTP